MNPPLLQLERITRTFPGGIVANDSVSLSIEEGRIQAIIGENGAGKSTLLGVLYGRHRPDSGRILFRGKEAVIESPADAIRLGIGMVTQHTTMIPALTALENVVLGAEPGDRGILDEREALSRARRLAEQLGIQVDWSAPARSLSVAALQKAEIVKALFRGARILLLDEPTSALAPQEADSLFALLHALEADGVTVVFVTHKLREVMAHSSRITVLRAGRVVGERLTSKTYPEDLLGLMLGRSTSSPGVPISDERPHPARAQPAWERGAHSEGAFEPDGKAPPLLEIERASVSGPRGAPAVRDLSLTLWPGDILGIAGVDGSGQRELAEAVIGLRPLRHGAIRLDGESITRLSVPQRLRKGITFIPEDRLREGLVLDFTVAENLLLGRQREAALGGGRLLSLALIQRRGEEAIARYRIQPPDPDARAAALSGGNQQKLVLARALEGNTRLIVGMQPTRGLDVESARLVYSLLQRKAGEGCGILLFSLDLDELLELSSRIAVLFSGFLVGELPRAEATAEQIGRLMTEGRP